MVFKKSSDDIRLVSDLESPPSIFESSTTRILASHFLRFIYAFIS